MAELNQHRGGSPALPEPAVRTRWTPKPEQVLILESIFNSGMVNPPRDETVRIRKLLEKFGSVGDANVFYWFQNRRSRSRRRQRQLQAALTQPPLAAAAATGGGVPSYEPTSSYFINSCSDGCGGFFPCSPSSSSSSDDLFAISRQMGFTEIAQSPPPFDCSSEFYHQLGFITVFIDGVPSEVPRGPMDLRATFGDNAMMLVHSTGELLPVNEHGILTHSLQMGESYFLVRRPN